MRAIKMVLMHARYNLTNATTNGSLGDDFSRETSYVLTSGSRPA